MINTSIVQYICALCVEISKKKIFSVQYRFVVQLLMMLNMHIQMNTDIFDMVKLSIHLFEVVVYTFNGISTLFRQTLTIILASVGRIAVSLRTVVWVIIAGGTASLSIMWIIARFAAIRTIKPLRTLCVELIIILLHNRYITLDLITLKKQMLSLMKYSNISACL